eukprot:9230079-Lingulodinium_polyedra.AAC.1
MGRPRHAATDRRPSGALPTSCCGRREPPWRSRPPSARRRRAAPPRRGALALLAPSAGTPGPCARPC